MRENTGLPYASTLSAVDDAGNKTGVAHACGHDAHVTCLPGFAPVIEPTLSRGTQALVVAALTYLAK